MKGFFYICYGYASEFSSVFASVSRKEAREEGGSAGMYGWDWDWDLEKWKGREER